MREEYAIVLDFLPHGYPFDPAPVHRKSPIAQALGLSKLVVVELVVNKEVHLSPHEKVYVGDKTRDKIHHIKGIIPLNKLTTTASSELPYVLKAAIKEQEQRFVDFFNKAQPLSMRMHQLELLPGLGKKHMWEIIDSRKEKPFESFSDIKQRISLMPDVVGLIAKRIIKELEGKDKHRLFVRE